MIHDDINLNFIQKTTAPDKMPLERNILEASKKCLVSPDYSNENLDQVTAFQVATLVGEGKGQVLQP